MLTCGRQLAGAVFAWQRRVTIRAIAAVFVVYQLCLVVCIYGQVVGLQCMRIHAVLQLLGAVLHRPDQPALGGAQHLRQLLHRATGLIEMLDHGVWRTDCTARCSLK